MQGWFQKLLNARDAQERLDEELKEPTSLSEQEIVMENPTKMSDLGYHYFRKPPYYVYIYIYICRTQMTLMYLEGVATKHGGFTMQHLFDAIPLNGFAADDLPFHP